MAVRHYLIGQLTEFVNKETCRYYADQTESAINRVRNGEVDVDKLIDAWCDVFQEEHKAYSNTVELQDTDVFSQYYHSLIHSAALETLFDVEQNYATVVRDICEERDRDLATMKEKHEEEMDQVVSNVGKTYTDEDVNLLATKHFENKSMLESQFASELSSLKLKQKQDYRELVVRLYEESQTLASSPLPATSRVSKPEETRAEIKDPSPQSVDVTTHNPAQHMEESFTVNLGAQQKTMHNLRLMCIDPLNLCRTHYIQSTGSSSVEPQRLQTAMSLYSNQLCGLVLLVDNRINSYTGMKNAFAKICERSSEFHFDELDHQLHMIREDAVRVGEQRRRGQVPGAGGSAGERGGSAGESSGGAGERVGRLRSGDVYITRHSTLSQCHVVFHLVSDDSVATSDITSRHAAILALRNILKTACQYDMTTLSLPLLLTYDLTEEMTVAWCVKRAELVYKCVKGFMIEMASWGSNQSHTVQFIVPLGITESLFATFSNMLPQIFTISNPKLLREVATRSAVAAGTTSRHTSTAS